MGDGLGREPRCGGGRRQRCGWAAFRLVYRYMIYKAPQSDQVQVHAQHKTYITSTCTC